MPEWWSLVNTILGVVLLGFGWVMRTGWQVMADKLDLIGTNQAETKNEITSLKMEVRGHTDIDRQRFDEHERRLDRLDTHIDRLQQARP